MTIDVEGPINRILAGAERRFDAHIRDLSPPPLPFSEAIDAAAQAFWDFARALRNG